MTTCSTGHLEDAHDNGQQIDLGCEAAGFSYVHGRQTDTGEAGDVGHADASALTRLGEGFSVEAKQNATGHMRSEDLSDYEARSREVPHILPMPLLYPVVVVQRPVLVAPHHEEQFDGTPRPVAQSPTPRIPVAAGSEPRFDAIPTPRVHQPVPVVRPLYWSAKDLREEAMCCSTFAERRRLKGVFGLAPLRRCNRHRAGLPARPPSLRRVPRNVSGLALPAPKVGPNCPGFHG